MSRSPSMLRVEVTADDLAHGTRGAIGCALASAIERAGRAARLKALYVQRKGQLHAVPFAYVTGELILVSIYKAVVPDAVREWIGRYDLGAYVIPITFNLELELVNA